MRGVVGLLFLAGAILLFGGALIVSRVPHAPKWMTGSGTSQAAMLGSIFCAGLGLGLVGEFAVKYGFRSLSPWETALVGVSALLLAGSWYGIRKTLKRLPRPIEYIATGMFDAHTLTGAKVVPFSAVSSVVANAAPSVPPSKRPRKKRVA